MEEASLNIDIKNVLPVELGDLTASLSGVAEEYQRYLSRNDPEVSAADVRLYIREIGSGSIKADIVALGATVLPFVGYANTIIGFTKHLKTAYDYLTGKSD